MPPDGAFNYVFEYLDLAHRWKRRIPERTVGPRASEELQRDVRSILNSIQVR